MEFKKIKPGELSLTFFIDGTGANGRQVDVREQVDQFQHVTGYNGHIHRTHYLKVAWGTLQVKRCVLKSASIAYKLFQPDGVPLRAVITATFTDNSDDTTRVAMAQDESADLTHVRLVKAGDTLPALCQADLRRPALLPRGRARQRPRQLPRLPPGMRLLFPPLEQVAHAGRRAHPADPGRAPRVHGEGRRPAGAARAAARSAPT